MDLQFLLELIFWRLCFYLGIYVLSLSFQIYWPKVVLIPSLISLMFTISIVTWIFFYSYFCFYLVWNFSIAFSRNLKFFFSVSWCFSLYRSTILCLLLITLLSDFIIFPPFYCLNLICSSFSTYLSWRIER